MRAALSALRFFLVLLVGTGAYLFIAKKGLIVDEYKERDTTGQILRVECTYFTGFGLSKIKPPGSFAKSCPWLIDQ